MGFAEALESGSGLDDEPSFETLTGTDESGHSGPAAGADAGRICFRASFPPGMDRGNKYLFNGSAS